MGVDDLLDLRPYALQILHNLIRPKAHDLPAFPLHCGSSASICIDLKSVVIAIDFNDELT